MVFVGFFEALPFGEDQAFLRLFDFGDELQSTQHLREMLLLLQELIRLLELSHLGDITINRCDIGWLVAFLLPLLGAHFLVGLYHVGDVVQLFYFLGLLLELGEVEINVLAA